VQICSDHLRPYRSDSVCADLNDCADPIQNVQIQFRLCRSDSDRADLIQTIQTVQIRFRQFRLYRSDSDNSDCTDQIQTVQNRFRPCRSDNLHLFSLIGSVNAGSEIASSSTTLGTRLVVREQHYLLLAWHQTLPFDYQTEGSGARLTCH